MHVTCRDISTKITWWQKYATKKKNLCPSMNQSWMSLDSKMFEISIDIWIEETSVLIPLDIFNLQGNPQQSAESSTLDCHLVFLGRSFQTLPEAIEALQTTPLHDDDSRRDIWCTTICPGLPFSNVMTPYKRTKWRNFLVFYRTYHVLFEYHLLHNVNLYTLLNY